MKDDVSKRVIMGGLPLGMLTGNEAKEFREAWKETGEENGISVVMYKAFEGFGICVGEYEYADDDCIFWEYAKSQDIPGILEKEEKKSLALIGHMVMKNGSLWPKEDPAVDKVEWIVEAIEDLETHELYSAGEVEIFCRKNHLQAAR